MSKSKVNILKKVEHYSNLCHISYLDKVGCAFPMAILADFRMGKHRDDDYEEDTPYFRLFPTFYNVSSLNKTGVNVI